MTEWLLLVSPAARRSLSAPRSGEGGSPPLTPPSGTFVSFPCSLLNDFSPSPPGAAPYDDSGADGCGPPGRRAFPPTIPGGIGGRGVVANPAGTSPGVNGWRRCDPESHLPVVGSMDDVRRGPWAGSTDQGDGSGGAGQPPTDGSTTRARSGSVTRLGMPSTDTWTVIESPGLSHPAVSWEACCASNDGPGAHAPARPTIQIVRPPAISSPWSGSTGPLLPPWTSRSSQAAVQETPM